MKKMILIIVTLFYSFSSFAQNATSESTSMKNVMVMHDEVMSEMPELVQLIGKLESKANTNETDEKYVAAIENLKAANRAMVDWMENFGRRFDMEEMMHGKQLSEQKMIWLEEEKDKVVKLKDLINSSMDDARKLLE